MVSIQLYKGNNKIEKTFSIDICVGSVCNYNCSYCCRRFESIGNSFKSNHDLNVYLDKLNSLNIALQFNKINLQVKSLIKNHSVKRCIITLHGGETSLYDIYKIVSFIAVKMSGVSLEVSIVTNLSMPVSYFVNLKNKLKLIGVNDLSLIASFHDEFVKIDSFISKVLSLNEIGIRTFIMYVLSNDTSLILKDILSSKYCKSEDIIPLLSISKCFDAKTRDIISFNNFTSDVYKEYSELKNDIRKKRGINTFYKVMFNNKVLYTFSSDIFFNICKDNKFSFFNNSKIFLNKIAINSNGNIMFCSEGGTTLSLGKNLFDIDNNEKIEALSSGYYSITDTLKLESLMNKSIIPNNRITSFPVEIIFNEDECFLKECDKKRSFSIEEINVK